MRATTNAVILAAGQGTRMKSHTHKVLHRIGGLPMVEHIVNTLEQLEIDHIVVVVGYGAEAVKSYLGDRVQYALQKEQLGTAHAVRQAESLIGELPGVTLVINGDNPLITTETYRDFVTDFTDKQVAGAMLTAVYDDPTGYGRVQRSPEGDVERVVEEKDANEAQRAIREINTGTFCFDTQKLFAALRQVKNDNVQGEYYLPDALTVLQEQGEKITAFCVADASETIGINNRVQLAEAEAVFRKRTLERHMMAGVTIIDPNQTYIEANVVIGKDTVLWPGTILRGDTVIGEACVIGPQVDIDHSRIMDRATVQHSTVKESTVGTEASVGPYAYLRPDSVIGERAKIGDFVEVKNSVIGADSKVSHHSYIGDAELGQAVNIGCGAITVNYDGERKWRTKIGDRSFVGCNVNLVAPVTVGDDTVIAAGSTITDDVPEGAFAIARKRQTTKENYVQKLKAKRRENE